MSEPAVDIAVIGGGIAGASAAYWLARHRSSPSVALLEAEAHLAHHTTGRSAAQLILNLGAAPLRPLTLASMPFLHHPPDGFAHQSLVSPRAVLTVAPPGGEAAAERVLADGRAIDPTVSEVSVDDAIGRFPALRREATARVIYEPSCDDLDVAALHHGFVAGARRAGAAVLSGFRLAHAQRGGGQWRVSARDGRRLSAALVVNAAGAWGDVVADICGVPAVALTPRRRTAFMTPSHFPASDDWPMVVDVNHRWYAKPDGTQFLCSPGDQTPSPPCDAQPEELDVARAIESINAATTLGIRTVTSSWAGLRTFAPDESMVIGPDPNEPAFIWCAGQGGTGIQTAPAAGRLLSDLALDGAPSGFFDDVDLDLAGLTPERLASSPAPDASSTPTRRPGAAFPPNGSGPAGRLAP